MKYSSGEEIKLGDKVKLGEDNNGRVIGILDDKAGLDADFMEVWGHLEKGFLTKFPKYGIIHYETAEPDLELISRMSGAS